MVSQTNEKALEATIEGAFADISRDELMEQAGGDMVVLRQAEQYRTEVGNGYQIGWSSNFYRKLFVDRAKFWSFLDATQYMAETMINATFLCLSKKIVKRKDTPTLASPSDARRDPRDPEDYLIRLDPPLEFSVFSVLSVVRIF